MSIFQKGKGRNLKTGYQQQQQEEGPTKVSYKSNDQKLFDEMPFPDLHFDVDGVLIPAHRGIVASRCPSFAKTLSEQTDQSRPIKIEDMNFMTLKSFLEFLYCGECKFENVRSAIQLFEQAKMDSLTNLSDIAEKYLLKQITTEHAVELANFSDKYSLPNLFQAAVHFLALNFEQLFVDERSKHQISELSNNILIKLFKDKKRLAALRDPNYLGLGNNNI